MTNDIDLVIIVMFNIISYLVFKFGVIGGIFLYWFVDSMLFTMMIKTEFNEPVKSIKDLIDREMSLGDIVELRNISRLSSHCAVLLEVDQ